VQSCYVLRKKQLGGRFHTIHPEPWHQLPAQTTIRWAKEMEKEKIVCLYVKIRNVRAVQQTMDKAVLISQNYFQALTLRRQYVQQLERILHSFGDLNAINQKKEE
jgi:hypothetical protein